ncbi:hypothetical protein JY98_03640 [Exiguobacterium mexicanum]|nr:hypothetical protein JY98_03640 [Exiguobacterium mexicanum]
MLTDKQLDAFFEGLLYAGIVAFVTTMIFNQSKYWLIGAGITLAISGIAATLSYLSKEETS